MAIPIWKDKFCDLGAVASQYFRIQVDSTTIYQGRAFRAASSGNLYIRINDICADYMAKRVPSVPNAAPAKMSFPVSFIVQKSTNQSNWITVETVSFNDDWSYDTSFNPSTMGYAFPITGRCDLRQRVYQTRAYTGTVNVSAKYGNTTRSISRTTATSSNGTAFENGLNHAGAAYLMFPCYTHASYQSKPLERFTIGVTTYTITKACPRYCLYYKNPYGGYDHLLLEGAVTLRRSNARDTFKADYDNGAGGREEWVFQNETTETYEVNTGLLTDDESSRLPYLLDSPDVYLCDLEDATVFIPAVIATDTYTYRSVNTNGIRMKNHTFEVKVAQNEYRR